TPPPSSVSFSRRRRSGASIWGRRQPSRSSISSSSCCSPGSSTPRSCACSRESAEMRLRTLALIVYFILLMLPIYWLLLMSLQTTDQILGGFKFFPAQPTLANFERILTDYSWYSGYLHSLSYVVLNTIISLSVALPAAYAFSRYRF